MKPMKVLLICGVIFSTASLCLLTAFPQSSADLKTGFDDIETPASQKKWSLDDLKLSTDKSSENKSTTAKKKSSRDTSKKDDIGFGASLPTRDAKKKSSLDTSKKGIENDIKMILQELQFLRKEIKFLREEIKKLQQSSNKKVSRTPSVTVAPSAIESRLDGDWEGWDGDTIIKLMNGQIWQQVDYHYEYNYSYMPDVVIFKTNNGYKALVEGVDKAVGVERIK